MFLKILNPPLIDRAIADAISLQQEHKLDEAIEKWRGIAKIAEETDNDLAARAWFSIGYLLSGQGKHKEAIDAYYEAIRLRPDASANAYNNRGVAKSKLGQNESAIADYDEALRLDSDNASAYNNRGHAKTKLGRKDEAREDLRAALKLARAAGDKKLGALAEQKLRELDKQ